MPTTVEDQRYLWNNRHAFYEIFNEMPRLNQRRVETNLNCPLMYISRVAVSRFIRREFLRPCPVLLIEVSRVNQLIMS